MVSARLLLAVVAGLVLGAGSALWVTGDARLVGQENAGAWTTNRFVGAQAANPYTRAIVARRGLLGMNRSEAAYFQRFDDAKGNPLDERCTYRITGGAIPARWWAITIYAEDDFLPRNGQDAYSLDKSGVAAAPNGTWSGILAPDRPGGTHNWISTRNAGEFLLTLRLYHPDAKALARTENLALPTVTPLQCAGDAA